MQDGGAHPRHHLHHTLFLHPRTRGTQRAFYAPMARSNVDRKNTPLSYQANRLIRRIHWPFVSHPTNKLRHSMSKLSHFQKVSIDFHLGLGDNRYLLIFKGLYGFVLVFCLAFSLYGVRYGSCGHMSLVLFLHCTFWEFFLSFCFVSWQSYPLCNGKHQHTPPRRKTRIIIFVADARN